jgi:hypothetical protein
MYIEQPPVDEEARTPGQLLWITREGLIRAGVMAPPYCRALRTADSVISHAKLPFLGIRFE